MKSEKTKKIKLKAEKVKRKADKLKRKLEQAVSNVKVKKKKKGNKIAVRPKHIKAGKLRQIVGVSAGSRVKRAKRPKPKRGVKLTNKTYHGWVNGRYINNKRI